MECNVGVVNAAIRVFGRSIHSLETIKAVDDTVDALVTYQRELSDLASVIHDVLERVINCTDGVALDPNGDIVDCLEESQDLLRAIHLSYSNKENAISGNGNLKNEHKEAVISEIRNFLGLAYELNDLTEQLKWAVVEHDADLSESVGEFDNVEDLVKHLRAS